MLLQALLLLLRHPPGFTCRSGGYRASLSPKPESLPAAQRGPQTPVSLSLPKQVPWAQLINVSRSFSTASRISISVRPGLSPVKVCHVLILCLPFFQYILSTRAMQSIRSFFPQDILFTRLKTTQNPRSRSFHLRTARMFECTLFILCCSCPSPSVACTEAGTAHWVLCCHQPWSQLEAQPEKSSGKRYQLENVTKMEAEKNTNIFIPTVTSIDESRSECENIYSSKVI